MEIQEISDDVFWKEATRRWTQKKLVLADPHRRAVMSGRNGGQFQEPASEQKGYPIICSACGRHAVVPFEPRPGYPVYCLECYNRRR